MSLDRMRSKGVSPAERVRDLWGRHRSSVLIACVLVAVLLLATLRWPGGLRVSGRLIAGTVTVVLDDGLQIEPDLDLEPPQVRLSGLQLVQAPPELATQAIEATSVAFRAARITLSGIHLGAGSELTLDSGAGTSTWLAASGTEGSLDFEAQGPLSMTVGGRSLTTVAMSDPLALSARAKGSSALPLSLSGGQPRGFSFRTLPAAPAISLIRFGRRTATDSFGTAFISTVASGTIHLLDVAKEVKLDPGAAVLIEGIHGHLFQFDQTESGYIVGLSGIASHVSIGPAGFAEDLTPTCLDYLYHQDWIKLMWAAALAGFAVLAKMRLWLRGRFD
jgi:hypothetical protein